MNAEERFDMMIKDPGAIICSKCKGAMTYRSGGVYVCRECGWEHLSQFGKVKRYIEANGPSTASEIEKATGVSHSMIRQYLSEGRVQAVEKKPLI